MIVDLEKSEVKYKYEELEKLINFADAKEVKVFVVGVTGVFRSGKSFFLGLLKTYLDHVTVVSACNVYCSSLGCAVIVYIHLKKLVFSI